MPVTPVVLDSRTLCLIEEAVERGLPVDLQQLRDYVHTMRSVRLTRMQAVVVPPGRVR